MNGPAQPGQAPPNLFKPEPYIANPRLYRVVPEAAWASRKTLLEVTNGYFDGITSHDGTIIMEHPACTRTGNDTGKGDARGGGATPGWGRCGKRLSFGPGKYESAACRRPALPRCGRRSTGSAGFAVFIRLPYQAQCLQRMVLSRRQQDWQLRPCNVLASTGTGHSQLAAKGTCFCLRISFRRLQLPRRVRAVASPWPLRILRPLSDSAGRWRYWSHRDSA